MKLRFDADIIHAKVSTIRKCVQAIHDVQHIPMRTRDAWIRDDVAVINLQRTIQACLDLVNHVIAENEWELPESLRHAFVILNRKGIIGVGLLKVMIGMAGFRNITIHEYAKVNGEILNAIIQRHLSDFERFCSAIIKATVSTTAKGSRCPRNTVPAKPNRPRRKS